jgi:hypothetical protein
VTATDAVEITLRHLPDADGWTLAYHLPRPVQAVRFSEIYPPRRMEWSIAAPLVLRPEGEVDVLARADGAPFESA